MTDIFRLTGESLYVAGRGKILLAVLTRDIAPEEIKLRGTQVHVDGKDYVVTAVEAHAVRSHRIGANIGLVVRELVNDRDRVVSTD